MTGAAAAECSVDVAEDDERGDQGGTILVLVHQSQPVEMPHFQRLTLHFLIGVAATHITHFIFTIIDS